MKIIAISPTFFLSRPFLGDATQMRKTISQLTKLPNMEITCAYYPYGQSHKQMEKEQLKTVDGKIIRWEDLHKEYDLAHIFLTPHNNDFLAFSQYLRKLPVCLSTVYWNHYSREIVSIRNGEKWKRLGYTIKNILRLIIGKKQTTLKGWCSCILPNSWAEGNNVRKHFDLPSHAISIPIPNALNHIPNLNNLERPDYLPEGDYIVCPGVFHYRKNQLGLIRALRKNDIPLVFMGSCFPGLEKYYQDCVNAAGKNCHFIGFKSSEEKEYWAVLKHARAAVLASDCETPGISMIEAAAAGARPIITIHGGTQEYFGTTASYLNPLSEQSIREAIHDAWYRGRLTSEESASFHRFTWELAGKLTAIAYEQVQANWKKSEWSNL